MMPKYHPIFAFKLTLLTLCSFSLTACVLDDLEHTLPTSQSTTQTSTPNTNIPKNLTNVSCLSQFYQQTAPELVNAKLKKQIYPLCFQGFTVMYSGVSKTPLWVAEQLSPERLSHKVKREDHFHEETQLPSSVRSTLTDYRGSGFDRGHMAPNGDMYDKQSQYDSFSLANIAPQHPINNQNTWREIEEATRAMVTRSQQTAYVITGVAFLNSTVHTLPNSQVLIPSHIYKAVYFPQTGVASAYLSANDDSRTAEILSICELEKRIGISLYPTVHVDDKAKRYDLPLSAGQVNKMMNKNRGLSFIQGKSNLCLKPINTEQLEKTKQQFQQQQNQAHTKMLSTSRELNADHIKTELTIRFLKWLKENA